MGVNWDSGLLDWKDHTPSTTERYSLAHLHPFVQQIELSATEKHAACSVGLYVSFGLHTFTPAIEVHDADNEIYHDNREAPDFLSRAIWAVVRPTKHHPHAGEASLRVRTRHERSDQLRHHGDEGW